MGKVVVLGSINQDLIAACERHPKRGEIVQGFGLFRNPGGKGANQAVAAARAGRESVIVGAVGTDQAGSELITFLKSKNVDTSHIQRIEDAATGTASILVDLEGEISIVAIPGANQRAVDDPKVALEPDDVLVAPLEVPATSIRSFFQRGKQRGCTTILNASPYGSIPEDLAPLVDVCVVNESELGTLTGIDASILTNTTAIVDAAKRVQLPDGATLVVAVDVQGAIAVKGDEYLHIESDRPAVVDTTGMADCFVGSLAALLTEGRTFEDAMNYASRAAAMSSTRRGAWMPARADVDAALPAPR